MRKYLLLCGLLFSYVLSAQVDLNFFKAYHRAGNSEYYPAGIQYYTIPENQVAPIRFSAHVNNVSLNIATNSYLTVEVYEDGLLDATLYGDSVDICAYCFDSLFTNLSYLPDGGTNYTFKYILTSDQPESNSTDNYFSRSILLNHNSWNTYRRDTGQYLTSISDNPYYPGEAAEFGNVYEIFKSDVICGVSMFVTNDAANLDNFIYGSVYRIDTASGEFWFQNSSDDYLVSASDLGNYVTLSFYNMEVDSGDIILVTAGHYGFDMITEFGQCQIEAFESVIGFCYGSIFAVPNNRALMVHPVFKKDGICDLGIQEQPSNNFIFFPISPNPAGGRTTLHYKLKQNSNIHFYLSDVNGRIIEQVEVGEQGLGEHYFDFELDDITSGVYFLTIQTEGAIQTQRLIVRK